MVSATTTITLDDRAFASETTGRAQQRGQQVLRGTLTAASEYDTGGNACDLTSLFPSQTMKYRVIMNPLSNTGNRLGVYDHTNKKLIVYTALGAQAGSHSDQSVNGIFSFVAIGE